MAGGAPVPVPTTSDPDRKKILSIADLEKAASEKLGKSARGKKGSPLILHSFSDGRVGKLHLRWIKLR